MDRTCFILGGADVKDDCDSVTLSTVLSRVSLRCQLQEFSSSSIGTTTTQRVYYLSTEQYKMVTNLANQIAASVNAPTAGRLSDDELEASTEPGEIAPANCRSTQAQADRSKSQQEGSEGSRG